MYAFKVWEDHRHLTYFKKKAASQSEMGWVYINRPEPASVQGKACMACYCVWSLFGKEEASNRAHH